MFYNIKHPQWPAFSAAFDRRYNINAIVKLPSGLSGRVLSLEVLGRLDPETGLGRTRYWVEYTREGYPKAAAWYFHQELSCIT